MTENLNVKSGIVCDSIRKEDNGKLLIVGVYAASILSQSFPASFVLSCLAIVDAKKEGEFAIEFETLLDGKTQGIGSGTIGVSKRGTSLLPIQNIILNNINPGTLIFRLREVNKDWQTIAEVPIGAS